MTPRPPISTLFPYTTLFRSDGTLPTADEPLEPHRRQTTTPHQGEYQHDAIYRIDRSTAEHEQHAQDRHAEQEHCSDAQDRKITRLNSSHANISYAVFCLKKK